MVLIDETPENDALAELKSTVAGSSPSLQNNSSIRRLTFGSRVGASMASLAFLAMSNASYRAEFSHGASSPHDAESILYASMVAILTESVKRKEGSIVNGRELF